MRIFEYTNKGCREENQDHLAYGSLPNNSGVYIVADGMGGYEEGAVAANVVSNALLDYIEMNYTCFEPVRLLKQAISFANDALLLKRIALGASKMGCVIAVLLISEGFAYIAWLGDSRIYMYRDGEEVYRTEDHSVINELAKSRILTAQDYEKYASMVTKSIMGDTPIDVAPIRKVKLESGDVFVLCTDGFHKEFDMKRALNYNNSQKEYIDSIATHISDNFSFIKVEI